MLSHAPIDDWAIVGYRVPRDTAVLMSPYLMHRDPRYYPDPERFLPERWSAAFQRGLPRFAYFPFGGGQRVCLGSAFAMMEIVLVLATLVPRIELTPLPERPPRALPRFTLRPEAGVWLQVARHPAAPAQDPR